MKAVQSNIVSYAKADANVRTAAESGDRIEWIKVSLVYLPLATPVSDAKVLTGRQKPLTEIAFIFAEIRTRDGHDGIGFGYSKRAGGPGMYAHAKEIAPNLLGEDPSDISKLFTKLLWAGASMGRSGLTTQAIAPFDIALWDLEGQARGSAAGQAAGRASRFGAVLQHVGRLSAYPAGPGVEERADFARKRHRRHQAQSGAA